MRSSYVVSLLLILFTIVALDREVFGQAEAEATPSVVPTRRVYIPVDELESLIETRKEGVFLSKEKFEALSKLASKNETERVGRPVGLVISSANFIGRIAERQLVVDATIHFEHFGDGWQRLPLPMQNLNIETADLDGQPAPLGQGDATELFCRFPGKHVLKLELSSPVVRDGSDALTSFALPQTPQGTLSLTVPKGKMLEVSGLRIERPTAIAEPATYRLPVGGEAGGRLNLRVTDRKGEATADALLLVATAIGVNATVGELTWTATSTLQAYGQRIDTVTFFVPRDLEITSVSSPGLEAWQLDDASRNRTAITLRFRQPFDGGRKIALRGVRGTETGEPWKTPTLELKGATSHVGRVLIRYPSEARLEPLSERGLRRQPNGEPSPMESAANQLHFEFFDPRFVLEFQTRAKTRELFVTNTLARLDLQQDQFLLATVGTFRALYAPIFHVDAELDAGWTIDDILIGGRSVGYRRIDQEPGIVKIRIPLPTPLQPGSEVRFQIIADRGAPEPKDGSERTAGLPLWRFPEASVVQGSYLLTANDRFRVRTEGVTGLDPAYLGLENERAGFRFSDDQVGGTVVVSREPGRYSAEMLTFVRLDPKTLAVHHEAELQFHGGGLRTIQVALPSSVADDLAFRLPSDSAQIIEQTSALEGEELRVWTLTFDRYLTGRHLLQTTIVLPREGDEVQVPLLKPQSADRVGGVVAVEASGEQRLDIVTGFDEAPGTLPSLDLLELPDGRTGYRPEERIVAAYRFPSGTPRVVIQESRFEQQPVPSAVASQMSLLSVVDLTGRIQHRVELNFSAVGVQNLSITLPADALLWATALEGEPIEVRRSGTAILVPLPPQSDSTASRRLHLHYETRTDSLAGFQQWTATPPLVATVTGAGEIQPVGVLEHTWEVATAPEMQLLETSGRFVPETEPERVGFLQGLPRMLTKTSVETVMERGIGLLIGFGVLFLASCVIVVTVFGPSSIRWWAVGIVIVGLMFLALLYASRSEQVMETKAPNTEYFAGNEGVPRVESEKTESKSYAMEAPNDEAVPADRYESKEEAGEFNDLERDAAEDTPELPPVPISDPEPQAAKPNAPEMQAADLFDFEDRDEEPVAEAPSVTPSARLSVVIEPVHPRGFDYRRFSYFGVATGEDVPLVLRYQNRTSARTVRLAILFGVLFPGWLIRRRSWLLRGVFAGVLLFGSLGLAPFLPSTWQAGLEGVFFGAVGTLAGWGFATLCQRVRSELRDPFPSVRNRTRSISGLWLLCGVALLGIVRPAVADEPEPSRRPIENALVVPYELGQDPLASDRIFLSERQFKSLWKTAYPSKRPAPEAPIEAVVSGTLLTATAPTEPDAKSVRVRGRIVIHSFTDDPVRVPIELGSAALVDATVDGETASLLPNAPPAAEAKTDQKPNPGSGPQASHVLLLNRAGLHLLDLTFDLPFTGGSRSGEFQIPVNAGSTGRLTLTLPEPDLNVSVSDPALTFRRQSLADGEGEQILIPLGKSRPLTIGYRPAEDRGMGESLVLVETEQRVRLEDRGLFQRSAFRYQIRQGGISEAVIHVPEGDKISDVTGPDLASWSLGEVADQRRPITLRFRREVRDATEVFVDLYRELDIDEDGTTLTLPVVEPVGVSRETGTITVEAEPQFALRVGTLERVRQIDPQAVKPSNGNASPRLAFRFSSRPHSVSLIVARRSSEVDATNDFRVAVDRQKVRYACRFGLDVQGAPRSRFTVLLPFGFTVLEVTATSLEDWYVTEDEDGYPQVVIELDRPSTGRIEVALSGVQTQPANADLLEIVTPFVDEATTFTDRLGVWVDSGFRFTIDEAEGWEVLDPRRLPGPLAKYDDRDADLAYVAKNEPGFLVLSLTKAVADVSGETITLLTVTDNFTTYGVGLRWTIRRAATDRLAFTGPDWLADRLTFRTPGIREVEETPLANGRRRWVIHLLRPQADNAFLLGEATIPPPIDGRVRSLQLRLLQPLAEQNEAVPGADGGAFERVEAQRSYLVLRNESHARVTLSTPDLVRTISERDIPFTLSHRWLSGATELLRLRPDAEPTTWDLETVTAAEPIPAAVRTADVVLVLARDGSYRGQVTYQVRNSGRQFLPIRLPEDSRILSVFVKEQAARPVLRAEGDQVWHLVAMPKTSGAELPFSISVVFAGRLPKALPSGVDLRSREFDLPCPHVISPQESAEFGIPVSQTNWAVYVPEEMHVEPIDDNRRTNVTRSREEDKLRSAAEQNLQTAEELYEVLDDAQSARVKQRAIDNLKVLNLSNESLLSTSDSLRDEQDLQQRQGELQRRIVESERSLRQSEGKKTQDLRALGRIQQRQQLKSELNDFYTTNRFDDFAGENATGDGEMDETFRFRVEQTPKKAEEKRGGQRKGQVVGGRVQTRGELEGLNNSLQLPGQNGRPVESKPDSFSGDDRSGVASGGIPQSNQVDGTLQFDAPMPNARPEFRDETEGQPANRKSRAQNVPGRTDPAATPSSLPPEPAAWTSRGGLSLHIDIPEAGRKLNFTTLSGQPRLAVAVWPAETVDLGTNLLWLVLVIGLALPILTLLLRRDRQELVMPLLCWTGILVGAVGWLFATGPVVALFGILFFGGALLRLVPTLRRHFVSEAENR